MCLAEKVSQKAIELGIDPVHIAIKFKTNRMKDKNAFEIIKQFPGQESEIKELNEFILELEYEKEIQEMQPKMQIATNQINL